MIKTIIFDLGGVLVPEKGPYIKRELAEHLEISEDEFCGLLEEFHLRATRGEMSLLEVYGNIVEKINKEIKARDLLNMHLKLYRESSTQRDSEILSMIEELKHKHFVVALTNTEMEIANLNKINGLFDYFDKVYISTEIGLMKPQREIYQKVLEDLKCSPNEVLFIDDKQEYVNGAEKVGIVSVLYQNVGQLRKDLEKLIG